MYGHHFEIIHRGARGSCGERKVVRWCSKCGAFDRYDEVDGRVFKYEEPVEPEQQRDALVFKEVFEKAKAVCASIEYHRFVEHADKQDLADDYSVVMSGRWNGLATAIEAAIKRGL